VVELHLMKVSIGHELRLPEGPSSFDQFPSANERVNGGRVSTFRIAAQASGDDERCYNGGNKSQEYLHSSSSPTLA